jgi:hypothetical protein
MERSWAIRCKLEESIVERLSTYLDFLDLYGRGGFTVEVDPKLSIGELNKASLVVEVQLISGLVAR